MNLIPGLSLRAPEEDEIMGIDDAEIGEFAYDYVEIRRDVVNGVEAEESASKRTMTPTGENTTIDTKA
jgi:Amt family ammonium transporter